MLAGKSHYVESEMLGGTGKTDHVSYVITFAVPLCYDLPGKTDYVRTLSFLVALGQRFALDNLDVIVFASIECQGFASI